MKHPFRSHILPLFTLGAGGLGFALRLWLFSNIDERGLLPAKHPAGTLLFVLSALVLGILFLSTRQLKARSVKKSMLRSADVVACLLVGCGLLVSAFMMLRAGTLRLSKVSFIVNLIGCAVMVFMAVLTFSGKKPPYWLSAIFTVVLMVDTIAKCQTWGSEPQLVVYFFPLMASVFLILTAYQKTALLARSGKRHLLAFFSQAAAFFCCVSFYSTHRFFYLGVFLWALLQIFPCLPHKKEA